MLAHVRRRKKKSRNEIIYGSYKQIKRLSNESGLDNFSKRDSESPLHFQRSKTHLMEKSSCEDLELIIQSVHENPSQLSSYVEDKHEGDHSLRYSSLDDEIIYSESVEHSEDESAKLPNDEQNTNPIDEKSEDEITEKP